jgi:hypothetical protein
LQNNLPRATVGSSLQAKEDTDFVSALLKEREGFQRERDELERKEIQKIMAEYTEKIQ